MREFMKTIIFLGLNKSGSSREAVKAAAQMGYYTVVFTNQKKQLQQRKEYVDVHRLTWLDSLDVERLSEEIILLQQKGHEIIAITSFIDQHVYTASLLADRFTNNIFATDAILIMENKKETREFFKDKPYTPNFLLVEEGTLLPLESLPTSLHFPVMVKVSNSTGSKDVIFAANKEELQQTLLILREKNPEEIIIIEEYIEGEQYLVEVLVVNEQINVIAVVEQEITRGERFIITGYGVLAEVDPQLEKGIKEIVHSIVSALALENGAFHLELRITEDGWKLIEINPRISGGAMNKMIQAACGFSLVEQTLKLLIGDTPTLEKQKNKFVFTQYIIIEEKGVLEKVTGKNRAKKKAGVLEVYVKPRKGTKINPPLSMGHRYAYIIATGETMEEAKKIAKEAAQEIEFHIRAKNSDE